MALPVRYYGPVGVWVLQAGSKTRYADDENGLIQRVEKRQMKDHRRAWLNVPLKGARHPSFFGLKVVEWEMDEQEADIAELTLWWEGILDPQLPEPVFTYTRHVTTEPIETHPDFVEKIGGTKADPKNKAKFDAESGLFDGFPPDAEKDLGGVSEYFSAGAEYQMTYTSFREPKNASDVPSIEDPPNAPPLTAKRNWLFIGDTSTERGGVFEISLDWMGSGFRGWNELVYGEKKKKNRLSGLSGGGLNTTATL